MDKKIIQKIGIIGDGLTGNLIAIALFRLGYPVELVGKKGLKRKPSAASISISNDSFNFLKKLKLKTIIIYITPILIIIFINFNLIIYYLNV